MFQMLAWLGLMGTLAAVAGHYLLFGPRHRDLPHEAAMVRRMGLLERGAHLLVLVSFLALGLTGLWTALILRVPLHGWLRALHMSAAPLLMFGVGLSALLWAENCRFQAHDWTWALKAGGYLGSKEDLPASRFNAGQKAFFWFVLAMGLAVTLSGLGRAFPFFSEDIQKAILWVHRYGSLGFFLGVVSHIYLATLANPGTLQVMISGKVGKTWARHHHPLWWQELQDRDSSGTRVAKR